jgi:hypothetical protein
MEKRKHLGFIQRMLVNHNLNIKRNIVGKEDNKHNKHFTDFGRNGWIPDNDKQSYLSEMNNKHISDLIKKQSRMNTKEEITKSDEDNRIPEYYKGKNRYEARKVCDNFDLTYHLATATTYILRAYRKHDTPVDCIKKAIAHLQFELEKIKRDNV